MKYDTDGYQKHKRPKGWGSLCPDDLPAGEAQSLLETGVRIGEAIYNVEAERGRAYCARNHHADRWHGYPIPWTTLPVDAVNALIELGRLDKATWRKGLRHRWGQAHG